MGQKLGGDLPFSGGSWVTIEHKVTWAEAYLHTKWHLRPSSRWPQWTLAEQALIIVGVVNK